MHFSGWRITIDLQPVNRSIRRKHTSRQCGVKAYLWILNIFCAWIKRDTVRQCYLHELLLIRQTDRQTDGPDVVSLIHVEFDTSDKHCQLQQQCWCAPALCFSLICIIVVFTCFSDGQFVIESWSNSLPTLIAFCAVVFYNRCDCKVSVGCVYTVLIYHSVCTV